MARIKIKDLPKDQKVSKEEMKKIRGGISLYPMPPDPMPGEQVSLNYGKIDWTYTQQKPDGGQGGNVAAKWTPAGGTS